MKKKIALVVILALLACSFDFAGFANAGGGGGFVPGLVMGGLMGCLAAQQIRTEPPQSYYGMSEGEKAAYERGRADLERRIQWEREQRAYERGRYGW